MSAATLAQIHRYPVKSLRGEALAETTLVPGRGIAGDRAYALAPAGPDSDKTGWRPKSRCVALVRNAALARFSARLDDADGVLAVAEGTHEIARGRPDTASDRTRIAAALNARLAAEVGAVALVAAGPDAMLSDADFRSGNVHTKWIEQTFLPRFLRGHA